MTCIIWMGPALAKRTVITILHMFALLLTLFGYQKQKDCKTSPIIFCPYFLYLHLTLVPPALVGSLKICTFVTCNMCGERGHCPLSEDFSPHLCWPGEAHGSQRHYLALINDVSQMINMTKCKEMHIFTDQDSQYDQMMEMLKAVVVKVLTRQSSRHR